MVLILFLDKGVKGDRLKFFIDLNRFFLLLMEDNLWFWNNEDFSKELKLLCFLELFRLLFLIFIFLVFFVLFLLFILLLEYVILFDFFWLVFMILDFFIRFLGEILFFIDVRFVFWFEFVEFDFRFFGLNWISFLDLEWLLIWFCFILLINEFEDLMFLYGVVVVWRLGLEFWMFMLYFFMVVFFSFCCMDLIDFFFLFLLMFLVDWFIFCFFFNRGDFFLFVVFKFVLGNINMDFDVFVKLVILYIFGFNW